MKLIKTKLNFIAHLKTILKKTNLKIQNYNKPLARLVHSAEKFGLKHLENLHSMQRRPGLASHCISPIGERRGGPAGLGRMRCMGLQSKRQMAGTDEQQPLPREGGACCIACH